MYANYMMSLYMFIFGLKNIVVYLKKKCYKCYRIKSLVVVLTKT